MAKKQRNYVAPQRRECTCRGENENCFKCFGTGWIETETPGTNRVRLPPVLKEYKDTSSHDFQWVAAAPRPRAAVGKLSKKAKPKPATAMAKQTPKPVAAAISKAKPRTQKKTTKDRQPRTYVRPTGSFVKARRLLAKYIQGGSALSDENFILVQRHITLPQLQRKASLPTTTGAELQRIEHLMDRIKQAPLLVGVTVLPRKAKDPKNAEPKGRAEERRAGKPKRSTAAGKAPRGKVERALSNPALGDALREAYLAASENPQTERGLDATKDYWRIRDHGQFGSHPSHDDFDE